LSLKLFIFFNGRYIDYLSLTYATNKNRILKFHYKYYTQQEKKNIKNIQNKHRAPNNKEQSQK